MVELAVGTEEDPLLGDARDGHGDGSSSSSSSSSSSLLVEGVVDYKGRRVSRFNSGGWRSAGFIIGVEISERFAYSGISANLITYLTGPLHQSTAAAAQNVNLWSGSATLLPLLGAFIADSYLGRFRTILFSSLLYVLALGLLTMSVVLLPSLGSSQCNDSEEGNPSCSSPSSFQVLSFFGSLYLVAIAQGGHKPCVQAFGADQFDGRDPEECKSKSSFFNWWFFGLCGGTSLTVWILIYIQENLSWGLGFGIPCVSMTLSLIVFLLGTKTYRFHFKEDGRSPFLRISQVFVAAARNWRASNLSLSVDIEEDLNKQLSPRLGAQQFKFLDKALVSTSNCPAGSSKDRNVCSINQVDEAKAVLRLVPIWATCVIYGVVFAQSSTFFTKQGSTMDRSIGPSFQIPAATLQTCIGMSIVFFIPIYDLIFVPIAKRFTNKPSGITMLQRIGFGMFLSVISMVVAAIVENKRIKTARDFGLIDMPYAVVPMRVWWLVPQYVLLGIADVFTLIGLQEFFYDQVPDGLRSVGLALYLSIVGTGSFLSGFLISAIDKSTGGSGHDSWFSDNLNRAHLDYFYWLLASLSMVQFLAYLYFSTSYLYSRGASLR